MGNSQKKPDWIRVSYAGTKEFSETLKVIKGIGVHTVCEEALCPNIGECWRHRTATFLIMGNICTRHCGFCNIAGGKPAGLDEQEPEKVAQSVKDLGIEYAVITCVTRDDLEDGGALHFARVIQKIKEVNPKTKVEILTSDLRGDEKAIKTITDTKPDVFGHNLEVGPRLHKLVKHPPSDYETSLSLLKKIKEIAPSMITKTGMMVGVGEKKEEVLDVIDDAVDANVDIISIGQYLSPTKSHYPLMRYVTPDEFAEYAQYGQGKGIKVIAGPLVRSSYKAKETYTSLCHVK